MSYKPPIILPEYSKEIIYSELIQKLMFFNYHLQSHTGMWREHTRLLEAISKNVELFNIPELHDAFCEVIFNYI